VWIDALRRDLHFAVRVLRRKPAFAVAVILTVALGIGANTAVVSVVETVLINPLGLRRADTVMVARTQFTKLGVFHGQASGTEFRELQSFTDAFSAVAAIEDRAWTLFADGKASRLVGEAVTPDFFRVFSEAPVLGRFFTADENAFSVVLSDRVWRSQFGGNASTVGSIITLDGASYRVVGIAPAAFRVPAAAQIWTPLVLEPERLLDSERGRNANLTLFARRKGAVSEAQAADRVHRYVAALKAADASQTSEISKAGYDIELVSLGRYVAGDLRRPLFLLWAAALVVLITGCANVAGLLLTRASARRQEMAIRIALGASTGQIIHQLLLESLLLGALGGLTGLALAAMALPMLSRFAIPGADMLALVSLDSRLLLYGLVLALASGLLFGVVPAIQLLQQRQSLQSVGGQRRRFQDALVSAEVCGAFVLIVLTTLLLRSLWAVERIEPGFDPQGVTTAFFLKPQGDPGFSMRLLAALGAGPGVQSAALANPIPFANTGITAGFAIKGHEQASGMLGQAQGVQITPDYFRTVRVPLVRGRGLEASDTPTSPFVCVIDATLAKRFFPGQDPIGQEVAMFNGWARVVGVVGAVRGAALEEEARPTIYYSFEQVSFLPYAAILVRGTGSAAGLIQAAVHQAAASVPVYDVKSLGERLDDTLGLRRALVLLLSAFGITSLLLAITGIYSVIAQVVSERTHEIGIRIALGARRSQILSHFMRQGLRAGLLGLALGVGAVAYAQRWFASILYQVAAFDSVGVASVFLGIFTLLTIAVWWPVHRAAGADPQRALRHE
jgi:predicted permease